MLLVIFLDQRECMIEFNKIEVDLTLEKKKKQMKELYYRKIKARLMRVRWNEMPKNLKGVFECEIKAIVT